MEKTEYRAVIKFFVLEGLSATDSYKNGESVESAPSSNRWVLEFKERLNHVVDVQKSEIIEQVFDIVCKIQFD